MCGWFFIASVALIQESLSAACLPVVLTPTSVSNVHLALRSAVICLEQGVSPMGKTAFGSALEHLQETLMLTDFDNEAIKSQIVFELVALRQVLEWVKPTTVLSEDIRSRSKKLVDAFTAVPAAPICDWLETAKPLEHCDAATSEPALKKPAIGTTSTANNRTLLIILLCIGFGALILVIVTCCLMRRPHEEPTTPVLVPATPPSSLPPAHKVSDDSIRAMFELARRESQHKDTDSDAV
ncbi:MAG: uncharacterized protein KVP18_003229 [Porospora cf. gigantea A]|uniref:uncharacterized protein n=1 Tax=Porospora cf. gigantea A TaxID=2853593 RepID=UPI003559D71D|nr:MAG: hypothetical protein KVP18_003229 [Porospora cf. gigantea A]